MSIKYIKQSTVNRALRLHLRWLRNERHGKRLTVGLAISLKINWSKINLRYADLRSADLRYANLGYANLSSADLSWVSTINVEDLRVISCQLNTSDQNRNIAYYPDLNLITAGCFSGTLNELKERVKEVHEKDDPSIYAKYQAVFTFIETVLEIEKRRNNHERKEQTSRILQR